jgi:hypothetical protein
MPHLSKDARQRISDEFIRRHNGNFNADLFFQEVSRAGPSHPAYAWFEWDRDKTFNQFNVERAREFVRDLRVSFRVEEVTGLHSVRVRETPMPMVLSPMENRQKGGGYVLVDPADPQHIGEHCRQAAKTLHQWFGRYQAALAYAGVKSTDIDKIVGRLEAAIDKRAA